MSNFNEYFKSTGLKRLMDRFAVGADQYSENKITKLDYYIDNSDKDQIASYYFENKLTAEFKIIVNYELNSDGEIRTSEFTIPKEIDGAFVINGNYRMATATLGRDYECRIYNQGSGGKGITFDYNRNFDFESDTLRIKNIDPNLGFINEKSIDIKYSEIDDFINTSKRELLRLTDKQIKKFQIKLDLDYTPEFITTKLIDDCKKLGDDRMHDFIIDKSIDTVATSFMNYMLKADNGKNSYKLASKIKSHFSRTGRLVLTFISSLANRFFRLGSQELQIPPGVNPINLDSFKYKIQINPTVAYNSSMSDLIDIADTPINQNTNLQNSLTISTHITDEGVKFDVYDKEFNKITIDYYDYLNSKVVASEYVDYDNNSLLPNDNGQVEVKYRMRRKMISIDDIDLIDLHPDYRLSPTSRRIPFVNYTDSVRISMGTSMLKQSIQLPKAEKPLVDSGNIEELSDNVMSEKYSGDGGEVVEITPSYVLIKNDDGTETKILKRSAIHSLYDISVYSEVKVKVGDKVRKGDVIIGGLGIEKDTVKSGLNANVLFHAYYGLVNEDAVVVSESFADRMAHYSLIDLTYDVMTNSAIKYILPIGSVVKSKDPVVIGSKSARLNEINKIISEKLLGISGSPNNESLEDYTEEYNLIVPNNIEQAVVSDVRIQKNNPKFKRNIRIPDYTFSETSQIAIDEFMKSYNRDIIINNYPDYVSDDTIDEFLMDPNDFKLVYTVKVRIIVYNRLKVGDKLTNRVGCKGVISTIVPDEKMPIVNGKKIEVVMNPYSLIGRKVPSMIMEVLLSNISVKLHDNVESMKNGNQSEIMPMINKYYGNRFKDMKVQDFLKLHEEKGIELYSFDVGSFSKYTPELLTKWGDELGVSTQSKVMVPRLDVTDTEELKKELSEEEYNEAIKSIGNQFEEVEKPLMTGSLYMIKLQHLPEYSNKVTSDMNDTRYFEPIMGKGRYRASGQKI